MQTAAISADWSERNEHWIGKSAKSPKRPIYRARESRPLILCGHGVSLRVEQGTLLVSNGFTHHPQTREVYRFFKGDLGLPTKIIMIDGSGNISFDVIGWLAAQNVALFHINYLGEVVSVIGGSGAAFDRERVRWQTDTRDDPTRRLDFCCELIAIKIAATIQTMKTALPDSATRAKAVEKAARSIDRLERRAVRSVNDVLLVEAGAAAAYFSVWRGLPLRWPRKSRTPIPPTWKMAEGRSSVRDRRGISNRNATHPVNAMLNYAYALLHSQMQIDVIGAGFDRKRCSQATARMGGA
jgi:CRISP-associated protein Cas1